MGRYEDYVVSAKLAKKLKSLGVKQEAEKYWVMWPKWALSPTKSLPVLWTYSHQTDCSMKSQLMREEKMKAGCAAFTTSDLFKIMPAIISVDKMPAFLAKTLPDKDYSDHYHLRMMKRVIENGVDFFVYYDDCEDGEIKHLCSVEDLTDVEALGKMLAEIIERGYWYA